MANLTRDDIIMTVTESYIASLNPANFPDARTAQRDLLEMTQDEIELANAAIMNKDRKWEMVKRLLPIQVAKLMLTFDNVIKVSFTGGNGDYDMVATYVGEGPQEGIYTVQSNDIHNIAMRYSYTMTEKEWQETYNILTRLAPQRELCKDQNLVVVGNGIFDFDTKTLQPFTPDLVFLSKSRVSYNPNATSPVITMPDGQTWEVEQWMGELSDDEGVPELLWEIVGAVIRPNVAWNKSAWFYSEQGNNGKGTLCALMQNICGQGNYATLKIEDMGKDFMLEQVIGKSAIITDENDVGTYVDKAANLKSLITGDAIMINRKYKNAISYKFRGFMVQCLNELPKIRDRSNSIYRRQLFVPFRKCYTGVERKYIKTDYLSRDDVLEYVLKRVLEMDYYTLSEPAACTDILDEYKVYNDPIKQFCEDILPELRWDGVPFKFLYDLYCAWMKKNIPGSSLLGRTAFTHNFEIEMQQRDNWDCDSKRVVKTGHRMDAYEPLIKEYQLKDWMNTGYGGTNDLIKYAPASLPGTFRGIMRAVPSGMAVAIADAEKESDAES